MDNARIKQQRQGLRDLSHSQLIALAVQKKVMPFRAACMAHPTVLAQALEKVDGILIPEKTS